MLSVLRRGNFCLRLRNDRFRASPKKVNIEATTELRARETRRLDTFHDKFFIEFEVLCVGLKDFSICNTRTSSHLHHITFSSRFIFEPTSPSNTQVLQAVQFRVTEYRIANLRGPVRSGVNVIYICAMRYIRYIHPKSA